MFDALIRLEGVRVTGPCFHCDCGTYLAYMWGRNDTRQIDRQAISSCQHLPEICNGTAPDFEDDGWEYEGYCECSEFVVWEGSMLWEHTDGAINWCTP